MKPVVVGVWVGLAAVAGTGSLAAQQSGNAKVAYVNTQATLDSAAADFDQQSVMLSPTQRAAKRKDLQTQQQKLEQRTQELQQQAATRERELLDPIQTKVNSVIEGVRAAGNYAMIFDVSAPNNGIVTADKALDLTQRVIQQLKAGS